MRRCEPAGCIDIALPRPAEPLELGHEQTIGGKHLQPLG
jgi:hypothetical protein